MAFEAQLTHGNPHFEDYTPVGAIAAGEVVVTSGRPRIAHVDIAAGTLGALAAEGGVYKCPKATTSGSAIGADVKVYWNDSSNVITTSSGGNTAFGYTELAAADSDTHVYVRHQPAA